jgi:glycerate-2-kinase
MSTDLKSIANELIEGSIKAVNPYMLIKEQIRSEGSRLLLPDLDPLNLDHYERVFICGAGKGTAPMARAMEELISDHLTAGDIIVKYGHLDKLKTVRLHEAGHPVPDENTLKGTEILLSTIRDLNESDCVFVLLTGGGSALLESLPRGINLSDLQSLSSILLKSGASIHEINCIRKHISNIKGGQLARKIHPARCITLALSDVIGDDLSVIASGPTTPDPSSFDQTISILSKYMIEDKIPAAILKHLKEGQAGDIAETPKMGDPEFNTVSNIVIGNNRLALERAQSIAQSYGFNTLILTTMLEGEAKEIGKVIASIIKEIQATNLPLKKPACILLGGEPTVQIRGKGKGGRNQELALSVALNNIDQPFTFVSCGSDGTDGPTDAAGAFVNQLSLQKAGEKGLAAREFLERNDSYHFFEQINDLIKTGPTGTNVMDIVFALIP